MTGETCFLYSDDFYQIKKFVDNNIELIHHEIHDGITPLVYASLSGNIDVLEYLIEKNANVSSIALELACLNSSIDSILLLLSTGCPISFNSIKNVLKNNRLDILYHLQCHGADLSMVNYKNNTFLHFCIKHHISLEIIEYIINTCPNIINSKNMWGLSPLHYCILHKNYNIFKYLLSLPNINPNVQNILGNSPLHLAPSIGYVNCLLKHENIQINIKNIYQFTPLHSHVILKHTKILSKLLNLEGIDINMKDMDEKTALDLSIVYNAKECFVKLLENVDPGVYDNLKVLYSMKKNAGFFKNLLTLKKAITVEN